MISACMAVSVRELRTAVREWALLGIVVFFFLPEFNIIYVLTVCMRANALTRLRGRAGSSERSLFTHAISTKIL